MIRKNSIQFLNNNVAIFSSISPSVIAANFLTTIETGIFCITLSKFPLPLHL